MASEEQVKPHSDAPPLPTAGPTGGSQLDTRSPPTSERAGLWAKIKRYKVVEWTLAYIAFAYVSDAQDWPHAIVRVLSLGLILGVPMVALLAWYHGRRAQHRISGSEIVFLTLLLFVTGSMLWGLSMGHRRGAPAVEAAPKSPAAVGMALAVLPFVNLSSDKEQEFFSDGMTEEITTALAKISALKVVGRIRPARQCTAQDATGHRTRAPATSRHPATSSLP